MDRLEGRHVWEAQYWWAFSCLAVVGKRNAGDFYNELLRRSADSYPAPGEVESMVDEALTHLAQVLNAALMEQQSAPRSANGWERHLLALSARPHSAAEE
jgi:hypothetical protein